MLVLSLYQAQKPKVVAKSIGLSYVLQDVILATSQSSPNVDLSICIHEAHTGYLLGERKEKAVNSSLDGKKDSA